MISREWRSAVWRLQYWAKSVVLKGGRSAIVDYLAAMFVKFRFRYWTTATRQAPAFRSLNVIDREARSLRVEYFLDAGALLGAVRQGTFAGRPSDVDVHFPKRNDATRVINGLLRYSHFQEFQVFKDRTHLHFYPIPYLRRRIGNPILIDISYGNECLCVSNGSSLTPRAAPPSFLTADLFGKSFPICECYAERIRLLYGDEWKKPIGIQYAHGTPRVQRHWKRT